MRQNKRSTHTQRERERERERGREEVRQTDRQTDRVRYIDGDIQRCIERGGET